MENNKGTIAKSNKTRKKKKKKKKKLETNLCVKNL